MSKLLFESDRQKFIRLSHDAEGYHRRAVLFAEQAQSPGLVFNVASIAVECYLIALCAWYGSMPFNHNYASLMDTAEEVIPFAPELSRRIRALDEIFGICSLENYHHGTPTQADSVGIIAICRELSEILTALGAQGSQAQ
ncbi:hypothetical protein [Acerihabitans arboris]|uniref:HEPN domain-containing protein n=1 Tax=Acerihabitans arboris TaxID=2691583 RepID=A0A845SHL5_9GAMM|nr:hypothetical protein [Acerihabitans arboris]NDL64643.1 hypothetical protein [Acerihabitans arboris]